jgi:hypothetical protein
VNALPDALFREAAVLAVDRGEPDMTAVRFAIIIGLACVLLAPFTASAQLIPPGGSQFNPPLPPPPPPPKIEVPVIPKMGESLPPPPPPPKIEVPVIPKMGESLPVPQVQGLRRGSFGEHISKCLEDGAAAGLGPNKRSAYSRACANQ